MSTPVAGKTMAEVLAAVPRPRITTIFYVPSTEDAERTRRTANNPWALAWQYYGAALQLRAMGFPVSGSPHYIGERYPAGEGAKTKP